MHFSWPLTIFVQQALVFSIFLLVLATPFNYKIFVLLHKLIVTNHLICLHPLIANK